MGYQSAMLLNLANIWEWRGKVKSQLVTLGYEFWNVMVNGYGEEPLSKSVPQWNAQEKFAIYDNLHNLELNKVMDLKSAKGIWERA